MYDPFIRTHTNAHTRTQRHHTHAHTHTRTHRHNIHVHAHTYTRARTHARTHARAHARTHAHIHTHTHTHTTIENDMNQLWYGTIHTCFRCLGTYFLACVLSNNGGMFQYIYIVHALSSKDGILCLIYIAYYLSNVARNDISILYIIGGKLQRVYLAISSNFWTFSVRPL